MLAIVYVIDKALDIYIWVVLAAVIMSWLLAFNIVNYSNNVVRAIWNAITVLTEPVLSRIRRFLPDLGPVDISPIVLLLLVYFIQLVIRLYIVPAVAGY